jgi:PII-like signaling protein
MTMTPAKRVTLWIGEDVRHHHEPLYLVLLNRLAAAGVPAATAVKAAAGFGRDHRMHTTRILELSENLPVQITFLAAADALEAILPPLLPLMTSGVIDVQDTVMAGE